MASRGGSAVLYSPRMQQPSSRPLIVSVDGGIGDHVSAEPSVRYLVEKIYPSSRNLAVVSHYPRVFEHIAIPSYLHGSAPIAGIENIPKLFSFPRTGPITEAACFLTCHMADFHALSMLKRMLPQGEKTYRLLLKAEEIVSLEEMLAGIDIAKLVIVHAGKSWKTKTFPAAWWEAVVRDLTSRGHTVVLVGKSASDVAGDTTGIVSIPLLERVIDMRDKLALGELFALIARARVLVSNDTSLIQIAGAFDNWIVLMATIKHPDFVLPYRKGGTAYKTRALYKRLLIDDVPFEPIRDPMLSVDFEVASWERYLPEPREVGATVDDIVFNHGSL